MDSAIVPYLLDAVKGSISAFLSVIYDLEKLQSNRDSPPFSPRLRSSYYHLGSFSDRTTEADFITIECYLKKMSLAPIYIES